MKLTESLSLEHRVIEQVLRCLLEMASRARDARAVDVDSAESALRFLKTFADACHHKKEEEVLFPALARVGFSPTAGPVAVMLEEHELGRKYVRRLEAAVAQARLRAEGSAEAFAAAVRPYVDLLTQHISKEDHVLFPLADHVLAGAEADLVRAGFESTEDALDHHRLHCEMVGIADALGTRFGVTRAAAPSGVACCHAAPAAP